MIRALAKMNVDDTTYFHTEEIFVLCDLSEEDSYEVTAAKVDLIYIWPMPNGVGQKQDGYVVELKPKPPDGNLFSDSRN